MNANSVKCIARNVWNWSAIGIGMPAKCRTIAHRRLDEPGPQGFCCRFPAGKTPRIAVEDRMDRAMLHIDAG